ncbi:hypothetical protein HDE_11648 [Halotydeus destructor]|nr:hypothetical protein HDE_11648 [Halotydeus destructor]
MSKQFSYLWETSLETSYELITSRQFIGDNLYLILAFIVIYSLFTLFILPKKFGHNLQLEAIGNVHSAAIVLVAVPTVFRMCESVLNTYSSSRTVLDVLCNKEVDNVTAFWITVWSAFQYFIAMETVISYLSGRSYPVPLAIHHVYALIYYPICLMQGSEYLRALTLIAALSNSITYTFTVLRHRKLVSHRVKISTNATALVFELTAIFLLFSYGSFQYLAGTCIVSKNILYLNFVIVSLNTVLLVKHVIQLKQRIRKPETVPQVR